MTCGHTDMGQMVIRDKACDEVVSKLSLTEKNVYIHTCRSFRLYKMFHLGTENFVYKHYVLAIIFITLAVL